MATSVPDVLAADLVVGAGTVHTLDPARPHAAEVAVRDGRIIAVGDARGDLAALMGPRTRVLDDGGLTVLPALFDTHNHQLWTAQDLDSVQLSGARTIADLVGSIRERAESTPPGKWIVASRSWHETTIAERRLPTAAELDRATADHPVFVPRGGHVGVANHRALELAGISADRPDPPGGTVVRDMDGHPVGPLIEFPAFAPIKALLPELDFEGRVDALGRTCRLYNSHGIGAVRDPGIFRDDYRVYQELWRRGQLTTRTSAMLRLDASWDTDRKLEELEAWGVHTGFGDEHLRIGGVKIFVDGGVEGGALSEPYANDEHYRGHLFIECDELVTVVDAALDRGWSVGCHAVGDVAVSTVLDAYEEAQRKRPGLEPGRLVIEHAFFADAQQRRRAIDLGIGITVQHPLLHTLAGNMVTYWGEERTARVSPVRAWIDEGALVAAGSDCNVTPFDPMLSIWGLVTRETAVAGVQGPQHGIDRDTAFRLYTTAGAALVGEQDWRGSLSAGKAADLAVFPRDPLTCPLDELVALRPVCTVVGGRAVHDPESRLRAEDPE